MLTRLGLRLVRSFATLILATIAVFIILRILPGDPARLILGPLASPAALAQQRRNMGLDQPIYVQFWKYVSGFVRGDWGFDYSSGTSVLSEVSSKLPATIELDFYAIMFAIIGALVLAVLSMTSQWIDKFGRAVAYIGLGAAPFWLGLMLLIVFSVRLGVLPGPVGRLGSGVSPPPPATGFYTLDSLIAGQFGTFWDAIGHLVLPAVALGLSPLGYIYRLLRQSLQDTRDQEFVMVARGKGLSYNAAMVRHGLVNALLPALTAAGLLIAQLVAGSVLVEEIFHWPGVGKLVVDSVGNSEYAVVEAFVVLSAVAFVFTNMVVDVLYSVIDPRLRRSGSV